jgi:gamma-glutamyl-gamma-aminobutyrate hydrolase PuuD
VGVLWHPEAGEDARLFEALVAAASTARESPGVTTVAPSGD